MCSVEHIVTILIWVYSLLTMTSYRKKKKPTKPKFIKKKKKFASVVQDVKQFKFHLVNWEAT